MTGKSPLTFPWSELIAWYEKNGRHHLPWRQYEMGDMNYELGNIKDDSPSASLIVHHSSFITHTLYRVWLAEILLQQTQVDRVIPYFERILERYPTIHDLARASYEEFFPYYQGMGYYSRARNILRTAKVVSEEYGGVFPQDKKLLQKLPGVGLYTTAAILAFGYGDPYLAWDTNLEKVFSRFLHGNRFQKLTDEQKEMVEEDFRKYVSKRGGNQKNGETEGGKLSESDENQEIDEQSERVFSPLGTFGTEGEFEGNEKRGSPGGFSHESTEKKAGFLPSQEGQKKDLESSSGMMEKEYESPCIQLDRHASLAMTVPMVVRAINNALMDFAATVDLKNPENIDWEIYPIHSGVWYDTRGSLEPREEKKSITFPIPDATVIVILHQDHKVYYSPNTSHPELAKDPVPLKHGFFLRQNDGNQGSSNSHLETHTSYLPFVLPPALHRDTRQYVQEYFRTRYRLELSVRPVHAKWITEDGHPYIAVNAQIQAGSDEQFSKYDKKSAQEVLKKIIP